MQSKKWKKNSYSVVQIEGELKTTTTTTKTKTVLLILRWQESSASTGRDVVKATHYIA